MDRSVFAPIAGMSDKVGIYYKNLVTGDEFIQNGDLPLMAASVIKLPVLVCAFFEMARGNVDRNERFILKDEDKLPSCGACNVLHTGIELTFEDLYTLMIILSDNTATNMVIKRLGMDTVNACIQELGLTSTKLNRLLFDSEAADRGLENYISVHDMARLYERLYRGELVSPEASAEMLGILKQQRLKGKLPLSLPRGTAVAHKTGEDSGITHDVGIVYAKSPYILCLCSNEVDAPAFEMGLHRVSRAVFELNN